MRWVHAKGKSSFDLTHVHAQDGLGPLLLGTMRDMFLQELEGLLVDMDGDELVGLSESQVLAPPRPQQSVSVYHRPLAVRSKHVGGKMSAW